MRPRPAGRFIGPRLLRHLASTLVVALLLLTGSGPRGGAPAASASPDVLAQAEPETPTPDVQTPTFEDDDDDANQDDNTVDEPIPPDPNEKITPAVPDSLLKTLNAPPGNAAPFDTLGAKPPAAVRKPLNAPPAERRTPLGLHPAVFFLGLLVGHIFVVRAVD